MRYSPVFGALMAWVAFGCASADPSAGAIPGTDPFSNTTEAPSGLPQLTDPTATDPLGAATDPAPAIEEPMQMEVPPNLEPGGVEPEPQGPGTEGGQIPEAPVTEAPVTEAPVTEEPVTEAPPVTEEPQMEMPIDPEVPEPMTPELPTSIAPAGIQCERLDEWSMDEEAFELEVLKLVNQERAIGAVCGEDVMEPVPPVELNALLTCASRRHSVDMFERDFFDHINPDDADPFDRILAEGYDFLSAGENIAFGQGSPEEVMEAWMDSPGHCRIIMGPRYTELGTGVFLAEDPSRNRLVPYWTQNFGSPR